jgi:hypothetical protein
VLCGGHTTSVFPVVPQLVAGPDLIFPDRAPSSHCYLSDEALSCRVVSCHCGISHRVYFSPAFKGLTVTQLMLCCEELIGTVLYLYLWRVPFFFTVKQGQRRGDVK